MLIISAIAINSFADKQVRKIILAGADMLRFNFSYRTIAETIQWIKIAQETRWELNSSIKLLIDLPSEKIRLGNFDLKTRSFKQVNRRFLQASFWYAKFKLHHSPFSVIFFTFTLFFFLEYSFTLFFIRVAGLLRHLFLILIGILY